MIDKKFRDGDRENRLESDAQEAIKVCLTYYVLIIINLSTFL